MSEIPGFNPDAAPSSEQNKGSNVKRSVMEKLRTMGVLSVLGIGLGAGMADAQTAAPSAETKSAIPAVVKVDLGDKGAVPPIPKHYEVPNLGIAPETASASTFHDVKIENQPVVPPMPDAQPVDLGVDMHIPQSASAQEVRIEQPSDIHEAQVPGVKSATIEQTVFPAKDAPTGKVEGVHLGDPNLHAVDDHAVVATVDMPHNDLQK